MHRFGLGDVPRFFVDLWWIKSLRFLSTIEHTRNKVCHAEKMPSSIFQQRFEPIDPILTLAGSSKLQPLDPTTQDVPQIDVHPEPPKSPEHPKSMVKELTQSKRELVVTNFGLGSNKLKEIQIPFEGKKTDLLFEK